MEFAFSRKQSRHIEANRSSWGVIRTWIAKSMSRNHNPRHHCSHTAFHVGISAMCHKRTSASGSVMSAFPQKADIFTVEINVR